MGRKILSVFAAAYLLTGTIIAHAEIVDKVAAVVNDEMITEREVDSVLAPLLEQYARLYQGDELDVKLMELRRDVLNKLIDDKLILSEAKKLNIEVSDEELEPRIEETVRRFESRAKFEEALSGQGLTLSELKKRYREQVMIRRLIDHKIGSRITASPTEISDYYNAHTDKFFQPEEIVLRNILIRPEDGLSAPKALETANEILRRLKTGNDFAALAKEYSDGPGAQEGGVMGYVKKGDLMPEIEAVVFNLKEGEITDVIQTSLGYHIFLVEEKREARMRGLEEVKNEVEEAVFNEKAKERLKSWLDGLRKNAYIAFK